MKSYIYKLIVFLLFGIMFNACDEKVDVQSSFEFTVSENHPEKLTINYAEDTSFVIDVEQEASTTTFTFYYEVLQGTGVYLDQNELNDYQKRSV